ncbi:ABC transporter ATP-binding protein [Labilibaculum antarcticum]|uniref:ABC transporter ATP-binding protein n=1 Tax=Labilibaculum antarcticum TaxID=1717717 RepID=A0A1Y1CIY8_9BACT|nr:ATP-binding cassette domain-containing protein [Labilibaculum antarcticum]BAX80285.1 ABC transporter ATP-binding protein [Labilibaculum antarcticum]
MITLNNVNKSFANLQVLNDISITFEAGKTNLIIGQSGSGKTVLLKSIIGLHDVDSGSIFYNDRDFTSMNLKAKKEIRKEMGMVFQGGALFDSMSVEENVLFPLQMFSDLSEKEKINRANFCLDRVNIQNSNHLFPAEISGGMQKRVAIARAIALNPKYLFCDEPNSGLDPVTAIVIDNLIHEITKEYNMTTIINTHDMNSVIENGEKIIFISNGYKAWEGNKDEIFNTDNTELNNFVFASELYKKIKSLS